MAGTCLQLVSPQWALRLSLCLCLCLGLCVLPIHGSASTELAQIQVDYYNFILSDNPVFATDSFVHRYDDQLYSYSLSKFPERKTKVDELLARLKTITTTELRKDEMVSYSVLEDMLTTYIAGYEWRHYQQLSPVTFLEGPQAWIGWMVYYLPFNTPGDFENYLARLHRFPVQFSEIEARMREAMRLNRTNHFHSMSRLAPQFLAYLVPANQSDFYWPFLDTLDRMNFSAQANDALRSRGLEATQGVVDGIRGLWQFIENEYMSNLRPEIGISSLDGGRQFYEACIRWYLSMDMGAQSVHDLGLREVDRIAANMHDVMRRQGFQGTISEYFRGLLNDSRFFYKTGDELIEGYKSLITDVINPKINDFFSDNPELPIEVHPLDYDEIGGYYTPGTTDGSWPGIFWVNAFRPEDSAKFLMMALALHEANPGHHLQISIEMTSNLPNFRRNMLWPAGWEVPAAVPDYSAMSEGWALYSEYLGEEMGLYRDDYELMGRYSSEIFRACRLVVDTGIHVFNWTREESIDYFLNYTAETYESIAIEIDRYITWPGQALAYKVGELKIKELREKAENQLGDRFDLKEFHSIVLEGGTLPLSALERAVNDWLDAYPQPPGDTPPSTCKACKQHPYWTSILMSIFCLLYQRFRN